VYDCLRCSEVSTVLNRVGANRVNMLPRCKYFYLYNSILIIRVLVLCVPLAAVLYYYYLFHRATDSGFIYPWFAVSDRKNNKSFYSYWIDGKSGWQITPPCSKIIPSELGNSLIDYNR
jgi:hypothetical protein